MCCATVWQNETPLRSFLRLSILTLFRPKIKSCLELVLRCKWEPIINLTLTLSCSFLLLFCLHPYLERFIANVDLLLSSICYVFTFASHPIPEFNPGSALFRYLLYLLRYLFFVTVYEFEATLPSFILPSTTTLVLQRSNRRRPDSTPPFAS